MTTDTVLLWQWDGEVMRPRPRFEKFADERYIVGEIYRMAAVADRTIEAEGRYHATLKDLWLTLMDVHNPILTETFPNPDRLRYHALCMTGQRYDRRYALPSKTEAKRFAASIRPRYVKDPFMIVSVYDNVVVQWTPFSQSREAMPAKGEYHKSTEAVLEWVEALIAKEKA